MHETVCGRDGGCIQVCPTPAREYKPLHSHVSGEANQFRSMSAQETGSGYKSITIEIVDLNFKWQISGSYLNLRDLLNNNSTIIKIFSLFFGEGGKD